MGNNQAYTIMEATVIAAYNAGLRGEQLAPFLEPYRNTDIDSGGRCDLEAFDGKDIEDVIMSEFGDDEQKKAWDLWRQIGDVDLSGLDAASIEEYQDKEWKLENAAMDALDGIIGRDGRFGWC